MSDLRYALRSLARTPGFTAVAVLVISLGVGTTTASFSIANWLLLRPVPGVHDDGRLATVWFGHWSDGGGVSPSFLSYPNYADVMRSVTALSGLAGYQVASAAVGGAGAAAHNVSGGFVTANYFEVLGARLQLGRAFTADEDRPPDGTAVAVISDRLWSDMFNRDPAVLRKTIRVNGRQFSVIGVTARGFQGTERAGRDDIWLPGNTHVYVRHLSPPASMTGRSGIGFYEFVARLAPGATFEQAEAQLQAGTRHLAELHPDVNEQYAAEVRPVLFPGIGSHALGRRPLAATMRLLVGVTALVLLIACANVANLLLFRGITARGDVAVRRALGASLGRVVRQHLAASTLLGLAGGALGIVLALWLVGLFEGVRFVASEVHSVSLDWRVLAFACGASLVTGVIAGLAPAWSAGRADPLPLLKAGGPTETGRRAPLRRALAVAQLAIGVVLLVGALLFVRTLQRLAAVDLGFDPTGVTVFSAEPHDQGYSPERTRAYWEEFSRRLRATPGLQSVALASVVPFVGPGWGARIRAAGKPDVPPFHVGANQVSPEFFATLKIRLLRGAGFVRSDSGQDVVVLNQTLARRLFGSGDPVGQLVEIDGGHQLHRVVGVAADSRWRSLDQDPGPFVYRPLALNHPRMLLVRSVLADRETAAAIERIAAELDSSLPVAFIKPITGGIADDLSERHLFAKMLGLFGAIALGLAAAGLYGLVGFGVALRTREFGIRTALGAEPASILRLVLREAALLAAVGVALGLAAAALGTPVIQSRLYGVSALDPVSYAGAAAALALVAFVASLRPARMATRVDPVKALRYE